MSTYNHVMLGVVILRLCVHNAQPRYVGCRYFAFMRESPGKWLSADADEIFGCRLVFENLVQHAGHRERQNIEVALVAKILPIEMKRPNKAKERRPQERLCACNRRPKSAS